MNWALTCEKRRCARTAEEAESGLTDRRSWAARVAAAYACIVTVGCATDRGRSFSPYARRPDVGAGEPSRYRSGYGEHQQLRNRVGQLSRDGRRRPQDADE
jgi:hypothetical protein